MLYLYALASMLAFISGSINGVMDVLMGPFKYSRISHWRKEFWELYGVGQSWKNKFVNRDTILRVRKKWDLSRLGICCKIPIPMAFISGWHMLKFFWRGIYILSVVPIAMICTDHYEAVLAALTLWGPQYLGFYLTYNFLLKK